jgi:hypothetical protein
MEKTSIGKAFIIFFYTFGSLTPVANLLPESLTQVANLPPVLTTPAELMAKFAAGVVDTSSKFATSVFKSLIPVVHLDFRICRQIFKQI